MLTLAGLAPASVFAQEGTATSSNEEVVPSAPPATARGYTTEMLEGDRVVGDFVVGPGKTEMSLEPGESGRVELIVTNRLGETKLFNFEVEDVTGSQNPERPVILLGDDQGPYTLRDYIELPVMSFELRHNERARIPVTINIPEDAEPGGRYGSVLVTTASKDVEAEGGGAAPQSAIVSRIGTLFFITIEGDIERSGRLQDFATIPEKRFFWSGPITFGILYENSGVVHLNPYGILRIENVLGEEVGYTEIEPWFALPNSLRFREVTWDREFLFGRYTAIIEINRGYDDIVDQMEYSFWVLPWKPIVLGLAVVFFIIFITRAFFNRFEFKRKE